MIVAKKKTIRIPRITYATLSVTPKDDAAYEKAVEHVRARLGTHFTMYNNGEKSALTQEEMSHACPIDTRITVSHFPKGTREDAKAAIDAAQEAYPKWNALSYKTRIAILRKAADLIAERRYELSAWMAFEVGKNRSESLAEVNEAAELIRYYGTQIR